MIIPRLNDSTIPPTMANIKRGSQIATTHVESTPTNVRHPMTTPPISGRKELLIYYMDFM